MRNRSFDHSIITNTACQINQCKSNCKIKRAKIVFDNFVREIDREGVCERVVVIAQLQEAGKIVSLPATSSVLLIMNGHRPLPRGQTVPDKMLRSVSYFSLAISRPFLGCPRAPNRSQNWRSGVHCFTRVQQIRSRVLHLKISLFVEVIHNS
jgi:hypothetical protein